VRSGPVCSELAPTYSEPVEAAFGKMTMLELAWDCSAQVFEVICTQRSSCTAWTPVFIMEVVEIATAELADKLFGSVMRLWRREMA
jgi:hypothetical protein